MPAFIAHYGTKKKRRSRRTAARFEQMTLSRALEVHRRPQEDVTTEGVVGLRVGVAVARRADSAAYRRIVVEHVVDAERDACLLGDRPGRREVEVVLGGENLVELALGHLQVRRIEADDLTVMTPGERKVQIPRSLPARAEAVTPLRSGDA